MSSTSIYNLGLDQNKANYTPLSPLSFIERTAHIYPDRLAVVHGDVRRTWSETFSRTQQLAGALAARGVGKNDTVSIIAANIPELFECHFGVPMSGAVLNAINTRLDANTIAFILDHAESKVVMVDPEFSETVEHALKISNNPNRIVVDILDSSFKGGKRIGETDYETFLSSADSEFHWSLPADEWDAISLNYTSGTTGDPKGVVYHHRGASLNATAHITSWGMAQHSVYLWTLPMFHCNGWCFPWTLAAIAGVNVCLRSIRAEPIYQLLRDENVSHFCGAPIVLNMLTNAPEELKDFTQEIKVMTAGASPPAAVIESMENMGVEVTHVYGLTETYGPSVICAWKSEWDSLSSTEKARIKARQGVKNPALDELMVADPETLELVPADGKTMGEIFMRGNNIMRGYLKNPSGTQKALQQGWFASGDLGVMHTDGYVELKDRSKDIIISGGENISSVEVEDILYRHPAVMEAAVVARPDNHWGETPCAFVDLKSGENLDADELIKFCRDNMPRYKAPKSIVFGALPKTSTGKVQKYLLRDRARALESDQGTDG